MDNNQNPYAPVQDPVNTDAAQTAENATQNVAQDAQNTYTAPQQPNYTAPQQPYGQPVYAQPQAAPVKPNPAKSIVALVLSISGLIFAFLAFIFAMVGMAGVAALSSSVAVNSIGGAAVALYTILGMGTYALVFGIIGLVMNIVGLNLRNSFIRTYNTSNKMCKAAKITGVIGLILNIIGIVFGVVVLAVVSTAMA